MTRLAELLALCFALAAWWWALTVIYQTVLEPLQPLKLVLP